MEVANVGVVVVLVIAAVVVVVVVEDVFVAAFVVVVDDAVTVAVSAAVFGPAAATVNVAAEVVVVITDAVCVLRSVTVEAIEVAGAVEAAGPADAGAVVTIVTTVLSALGSPMVPAARAIFVAAVVAAPGCDSGGVELEATVVVVVVVVVAVVVVFVSIFFGGADTWCFCSCLLHPFTFFFVPFVRFDERLLVPAPAPPGGGGGAISLFTYWSSALLNTMPAFIYASYCMYLVCPLVCTCASTLPRNLSPARVEPHSSMDLLPCLLMLMC